MISALPAAEAAVAPLHILAPAPHEASFGRLVADVPRGTARLVVVVNGRRFASKLASGRRVSIRLDLPRRDSELRVLAIDARGRTRASDSVGPVFGLPLAALPSLTRGAEDRRLRARLAALLRTFRGTAAVYVRNLATGDGAAANARARFPAGSTLKLAIAVETLRSLRGPPARGSAVDVLMRSMLIDSDNEAANRLEVIVGGSTGGGSARVNATLRALGLLDSEMYGGYATDEDERQDGEKDGKGPKRRTAVARPIPIRVESQPSFPAGKYTSAADLGRLLEDVYLGAAGLGPLVRRFHGSFTPSEARYLLYLLVHVGDRGKLGRELPGRTVLAHKAGWISTARHDAGLVFWPGGAFVAAVMTWSSGGVGTPSDVLAGRVAAIALGRARATGRARPAPPAGGSSSGR